MRQRSKNSKNPLDEEIDHRRRGNRKQNVTREKIPPRDRQKDTIYRQDMATASRETTTTYRQRPPQHRRQKEER
jgi:hypothetical protein